MKFNDALRTSEFWVAAAVAVGQIFVQFGIVDQQSWETFGYPALVYIAARVTGKVVKSVPMKEKP